MTNYRFRPLLVLMAICLALAAVSGQSWGAEPPKSVLILPFKMNASQDMTFLQQGIQDMLTSRLAWENHVQILPAAQARQAYDQVQGNIDEGTARKLAQNVGADYVLFGSVTVLGQSVSLDAKILDLKTAGAPVSAFAQSQGMDGVIPKVNQFAEDVNFKVFGRGSAPQEAARTQTESQEPMPSYRRHPDYLLTGQEGQNMSPLNPNFLAEPGRGDEGGFWKSPAFPVTIIGMDIGDIDADGKNELVYASYNTVFVGRMENGQFIKLTKYEGFVKDRFLSLDVADINGNGRAEIFVSAQRDYDARSLVLEFQGDHLAPLVKDSPWYYRVVELPTGRTLLGQRSGAGEMFFGPIQEMRPAGNDYAPTTALSLPGGVNLFNFTISDLSGPGKENVVMIDSFEKLVVLSRGGQDLWRSQEYFGGTLNYIKLPARTATSESLVDNTDQRYYIPSRIVTVDLNADGKKEILAAVNQISSSRMFERLRDFSRGAIHSLSFDQMSVRLNWRSRELPGGLTDYQVKDYNNDGKPDLVVVVNVKTGTGIMDSRSNIVAYDLASPEEMKKAEQAREQ